MLLSDKMWKAFAGTMIPVRMMIGMQMLAYAAAFWWTEGAHPMYQAMLAMLGGGWWVVAMGFGGAWMLTSATCEGFIRIKSLDVPRWVELNPTVICVGRTRFCSYLFAGAVWGGLCYSSWTDEISRPLDFTGPVFLMFITWATVNDAYQRRKHSIARAQPAFVLAK